MKALWAERHVCASVSSQVPPENWVLLANLHRSLQHHALQSEIAKGEHESLVPSKAECVLCWHNRGRALGKQLAGHRKYH